MEGSESIVSNEEKTISRVDIILDDDSKVSYVLDWREQDGIVLPRVVQRLGDNAVFFRDDAKVILKSDRAAQEAEAAAETAGMEQENAANEAATEAAENSGEDETVEFDAAENNASGETEDAVEDDAFDED